MPVTLPGRYPRYSSAEQKVDDQTIERGRVLDLSPMTAFGEDMHPPVRHRSGYLESDVERAETVVHAPDCEQLGLELWEVGAEILAWHLALALAEQLDCLGINARLIALLEDLFGKKGSIVEDG